MITSIKLLKESSERNLGFYDIHKYKVEIDSSLLGASPVTIRIEFETPIVAFRNHDYTWQPLIDEGFANWYSPKIIRLQNQQLVQANQQLGIWELNKKKPHVLLWHFNNKYAQPVAQFGLDNARKIVPAISKLTLNAPLALLFPSINGIEVSRSKIPFSAIACFTDHCDFDTLDNLQQQREFFKTYGLKITKGFFLNHFSKRADSASFEFHSDELKKWSDDGHELAYHSLSQSVKPESEGVEDFKMFEPPLKNIMTWIDHGFQPYNLSLYENNKSVRRKYNELLKQKGINYLWNYLDSGTAGDGIINQLEPSQFTLMTYYNAVKHLNWKERLPLFIKNIIFHYYGSEYSLTLYRSVANYVKTKGRKKSMIKHIRFAKNLLKLSSLLLPIALFWNSKKKQVYPLTKYTPISANHNILGDTFIIFQTIEMVDLKLGLSPNNIDLLIKESGLFIAHTYFSAPMEYHNGRLFESKNKIDPQVEQNFRYLSQNISSKKIWNPTINQLIEQLIKITNVIFDCDDNGVVFILDDSDVAYRKVV